MSINRPITEAEREGIEDALRHCPEGTYQALSEFRTSGNVQCFDQFLTGVLARFVEPEMADSLKGDRSKLNFVDDLGVDSMTMMEIVVVMEECLGISMENEELMDIETYGDLDQYVSSKL